MSELKGLSPDAEIVINTQGGKQSKVEYGFHLCDYDALFALAEVLQYGASRYERDNWRKIPAEEHFNHMLIHALAYLSGDTQDDHLGHMFCRAMMFYATAKAEETDRTATPDKPEPWGRKDTARKKNLFCSKINCCSCSVRPIVFDSGASTCSDWCEAHPAEARKIMDEMEVGKVAGQ